MFRKNNSDIIVSACCHTLTCCNKEHCYIVIVLELIITLYDSGMYIFLDLNKSVFNIPPISIFMNTYRRPWHCNDRVEVLLPQTLTNWQATIRFLCTRDRKTMTSAAAWRVCFFFFLSSVPYKYSFTWLYKHIGIRQCRRWVYKASTVQYLALLIW